MNLTWLRLILLLLTCQPGLLRAQEPAAPEDAIILPESVPDPLEPFNRAMWGVNKGLMTGVIKPTSRVYRFVVIKPLREGISNFARNLTYPGRLLNNLLQARWTGARDETWRFLANSTAGVGGFLDVADEWGIRKSDADFGQTLGRWGWDPACFLMLPLIGPANERDVLGRAADTAANPLIYISPYDFDLKKPATYLSPYTYFSYGSMYNDFSDSVDETVRFSQAAMDPYAEIQFAWTFARSAQAPDFELKDSQDQPSLQTLGSAFFAPKDPEFLRRAKNLSVRIPATGGKLKFTCWVQPKMAPVVYIAPGLGSHRLAHGSIAIAELAYQNGYSAVCVSSVFHAEFIESASTAALPAYVPADASDLHVALTEIDRLLQTAFPNRLGPRALLGYSMGALHSLYIGAHQSNQNLLAFDRIVAIHTPVRLLHGVTQLDQFYEAPLAWPASQRTARLENTFLKVARLARQGPSTNQPSLPFEGVESRFLIGLNFRNILRDSIYASQRRQNLGVLQSPIRSSQRASLYHEILQYNYQDYFQKFAAPHYAAKNISAEMLAAAGDLRTYAGALRANARIHIIVNENDFLLTAGDLAWLRSTFPPARLTAFPTGGHLGNLSSQELQRTILQSLPSLYL